MPLIDSLSFEHGVESVCRELAIAPSTFYWYRQRRQHPETRCERDKRDDVLCVEIERVYEENKQVYGVRKVWHQLKRESIKVARCTVERLMKTLGLEGVIRGKSVKTTRSGKERCTADDLVNRQFVASFGWLILRMSPPGRALLMSRLLSMCSLVLLWGGECHQPWKPRWFWTHWNRRYGPEDQMVASSIIVIVAPNTSLWRIRND